MDINENKYLGVLLDDRYQIESLIGVGGMAVVYKALDRRLNRYVAIKIMRDDMVNDEEFRNRFQTEAHAVAMLSNPNIVAVYDVGHSDDSEYIVMELMEGITLKQYMEKRGMVSWKEAVHFARQTCRALAHAHERGIIHRDIKPQNIMLLRDGTIKVADFGIAALENEIYENNGQAIGSIHYISPEQARGECPDARNDIYSLGIVCYEMLTGVLPYTGDSLAEIAVKHMNADPKPIRELNPDVPEALEAIVFKAMEASDDNRYQSAEEMLADIDSFTQSGQEEPTENETEVNETAVAPVLSVSELSNSEFRKRRIRAGRVTYLTGSLGLLCVILALFVFLWKFWLLDVFSPAERIPLPNFVGQDYYSLSSNADVITLYNFELKYDVDTSHNPGYILDQNPEPGRSVMKSPGGIDVILTVNSGETSVTIPELEDYQYREAMLTLQNMGFTVEIENQVSDTIERNHVISTSPGSGKSVSYGSTVYLVVSSGVDVAYIEMPQLIGCSEEAARAKLTSRGLSFGGSTVVSSALEPGTVISQSIPAFSQVEEHTKIKINVSSGVVG